MAGKRRARKGSTRSSARKKPARKKQPVRATKTRSTKKRPALDFFGSTPREIAHQKRLLKKFRKDAAAELAAKPRKYVIARDPRTQRYIKLRKHERNGIEIPRKASTKKALNYERESILRMMDGQLPFARRQERNKRMEMGHYSYRYEWLFEGPQAVTLAEQLLTRFHEMSLDRTDIRAQVVIQSRDNKGVIEGVAYKAEPPNAALKNLKTWARQYFKKVEKDLKSGKLKGFFVAVIAYSEAVIRVR